MGERDNWRTYSGEQVRKLIAGLQSLLDKGLLDEEEQRIARNIQFRLREVSMKTGNTMVPFTDKENELLTQLEGALWSS